MKIDHEKSGTNLFTGKSKTNEITLEYTIDTHTTKCSGYFIPTGKDYKGQKWYKSTPYLLKMLGMVDGIIKTLINTDWNRETQHCSAVCKFGTTLEMVAYWHPLMYSCFEYNHSLQPVADYIQMLEVLCHCYLSLLAHQLMFMALTWTTPRLFSIQATCLRISFLVMIPSKRL